ncbi:MAG: alcohol dehydrogenase family protein [Bacteroidia bacterium]|nr:alcohol dehydrogenase family protein [Bacteroidia bacterium]
MNAITFHKQYKIGTEKVSDPVILDQRDAIVKVKFAALCGSDLHVYRGHEKGQDPGTVMGHEFVGEVVELGKEVKNIQKGDWVVSPFTTNCGRCYYCRIGLSCRCEEGQLFGWVSGGKGLQGAQAEYVRVPLADSSLLSFSKDLPAEQVLFSGDILSTGYYCASRADLQLDELAVVIGCGPVGLMSILSARELGAKKVIAIDAVPERLAIAEKFGAIAVNFKEEDAIEQVKEHSEGRGASSIMEAVGASSAGRLAFDIARPGATISTVGVHTSNHIDFSPVEAYDKNITYRIGRAPARAYMDKMIHLIASGKYPIGEIVSHRLALENSVHAYEIFDQKKEACLKVVFDMK